MCKTRSSGRRLLRPEPGVRRRWKRRSSSGNWKTEPLPASGEKMEAFLFPLSYGRKFLLGLLLGGLVFPLPVLAAEVITVWGTEVHVRAGPGLHFPVRKTVLRGERLIALEKKRGWYRVETGEGEQGWITADLVLANPLRQPQRPLSRPTRTPADFIGARTALTSYIRFFQQVISPADGPRSSLYPTTSAYSRQAIRKHGALLGILMTFDRLMHDRDEVHRAPRIRKFGRLWPYDPVEGNDFWWASPPGQKPEE
ncbi:MAG: membrane protein insertion efficiency factor YidD [Nitrospinota bacterium]|nr:MAG: membrane protein insertion efficiency factor YidD [Nitrospinota bacterium]